MSVQISTGSVEFTRPSNYSTDKSGAKVSLTFGCTDGTTYAEAVQMLDSVIHLAIGRAFSMVAGIPTEERKTIDYAKAAAAVSVTPDPMASAVHAPAVAPATDVWAGPSVGTPIGGSVAPDPIQGAGSTIAPVTGQAGVVQTDAGTTTSPSEPTPTPISDADLVEAITAKNARLMTEAKDKLEREKAPIKCNALIASYVPPPGRSSAIPQEKRREFLYALNALT
jgi:predicted RNase H-like HicB family nuclease